MSSIKIISIMMLVAFPIGAFAQPEVKGNPQELRQFLYPVDKVMTIYAEAEEKAYTNKAIISLVISSENKLLSTSMSHNSTLRRNITRRLIDTGWSAEDFVGWGEERTPTFYD